MLARRCSTALMVRIIVIVVFLLAVEGIVRFRYAPVVHDWNVQSFPVENLAEKPIGSEEIDDPAPSGSFQVKGQFSYTRGSGRFVLFIPDDCLKTLVVNGVRVAPRAGENWCDFRRGFARPADDLLVEGVNTFDAELDNRGGARRLGIRVVESVAGSDERRALPSALSNWTATIRILPMTQSSGGLSKGGQAGQAQDLRYTGTFRYSGDSSDVIAIVPHGCLSDLRINGHTIRTPRDGPRCGGRLGIVRPAGDFLRQGINSIDAEVLQVEAGRSLSISLSKPGPLTMRNLLLLSLALAWTSLLVRIVRLRGFAALGFLAFTALSLWFLYETPPNMRTYDVFEGGGHADFIKYVANQGSLPPVNGGWEYHQPPLYYILGAFLFTHVGVGASEAMWGLFQGGNWVLFQLFVAFSLKFLIENLRGKAQYVAVGMFSLWPMHPVHACRIGNDALLYLLCILCFLHGARWITHRRIGNAVWAALFISLGCFTKNTALPVAAALAIALLRQSLVSFARNVPRKILSQSVCYVLLVGMLTLAASGSLAPKLLREEKTPLHGLLFPGVHSNQALRIPVSLQNVLPWGYTDGLLSPFVSPWRDETGRRNFWLYLSKSAISGELSSSDHIVKILSGISLFSLYATIAFLLVGFVRMVSRRDSLLILIGPGCLLVLGMFAVALLAKPNACNQDFRYVYYMLAPLAYVVAHSVGRSRWMYRLLACVSAVTVVSGSLAVILMMIRS